MRPPAWAPPAPIGGGAGAGSRIRPGLTTDIPREAAAMDNDVFAELASDFQAESGVSRSTAEHMVGIFVNTASAYPQEQAQAEFTKTVTAALEAGEGWAREYAAGVVRTKYPMAPAIHAEATARGVDPVAAFRVAFGIPADAAAELARYIANLPR